jgi:hypothetical protein
MNDSGWRGMKTKGAEREATIGSIVRIVGSKLMQKGLLGIGYRKVVRPAGERVRDLGQ